MNCLNFANAALFENCRLLLFLKIADWKFCKIASKWLQVRHRQNANTVWCVKSCLLGMEMLNFLVIYGGIKYPIVAPGLFEPQEWKKNWRKVMKPILIQNSRILKPGQSTTTPVECLYRIQVSHVQSIESWCSSPRLSCGGKNSCEAYWLHLD